MNKIQDPPAMPWANEFDILKYNDGVFSKAKDLVVEERRAEIYVNGVPYASVMATPDKLDYLAIGYLFAEGAVQALSEIKSVSARGLTVWVEIYGQMPQAPLRARSCGFGLGSVSIRDLESPKTPRPHPPMIQAERIVECMEEFNRMSELFRQTGAVHSAWLLKGNRRCFAEDVGRHNALDKVIGQYLSGEAAPPDQPGLIFTTGRISAEMLLKTAKAGLDALISRGSASRLAVELAEKSNLILIGFSRGDRFKAFCGGQFLSAPNDRGAENG